MKIAGLLLVLIFFSFSTDTITKKERDAAIKYFKESKDIFLNDIKDLSDVQLNFKTSPERWSVAECIEHIAIAEDAFMEIIQEDLKQPVDSSKTPKERIADDAVWPFVTDRSKKRTTPEFLKPSNKFKTTDEAIKAFIERRDKNMNYVNTTNDDLRSHFMPHALGMLDDYQWLIVIAAHCRRHTLQIEEVMADPNFPKK
ncbi:MAG: DinB family protein [Bacteroidetes bacterium]|nr:DinB family protein [Bacteroidota bacterium]